jgi:hypothetical protein
MTVCVAAISLVDQNVVGACDMMLSRADDSIAATDDVALKVIPLISRWGVMYAGSPTHAIDIVSRAGHLLQTNLRPTVLAESMAEVRRVMQTAYIEELSHQISIQILGRYGIDLTQFRENGLKQFGDVEFSIINKSIREFSLKTSFLVCGTDKDDFPHLFTVASPSGALVVNDPAGRAAIGSGAQMALGALGNRKITGLRVRELLYRVCEAKFAAETAHGVGRSTLLTCWRKGFDFTAWGMQTEELKAIWERTGKEPVPEDAIQKIDAAFGTTGPFVGLR